MMQGEERQLETVRDADLVEDAGEVVLDRVFANGETLGDASVGATLDDQTQHVEFARCQSKAKRIGTCGSCSLATSVSTTAPIVSRSTRFQRGRETQRFMPISRALSSDELERRSKGPRTIQERVTHLSGTLVVDSRPNAGSRLEIAVPLDA